MGTLPFQLISALTVITLAGCPLTPNHMEETEATPIRTDRTEYFASHVAGVGQLDRDEHHQFTVLARYHNRTSAPVYLNQCGGVVYHVLPKNPRDEDSAYNRGWRCPGTEPIEVLPGEVRLDSIRLGGPNAYTSTGGEKIGRLEGHFRLVYEIGTCPEVSRCLIPIEERRSNAFRVETQ